MTAAPSGVHAQYSSESEYGNWAVAYAFRFQYGGGLALFFPCERRKETDLENTGTYYYVVYIRVARRGTRTRWLNI